ncbi:hypothetical protein BVRB_024420, partial [Beta vulgaris subsp. vulgaris]
QNRCGPATHETEALSTRSMQSEHSDIIGRRRQTALQSTNSGSLFDEFNLAPGSPIHRIEIRELRGCVPRHGPARPQNGVLGSVRVMIADIVRASGTPGISLSKADPCPPIKLRAALLDDDERSLQNIYANWSRRSPIPTPDDEHRHLCETPTAIQNVVRKLLSAAYL